MFKALIEEDLKAALNNIGYKLADIVLSIPENSKFGDYSTNVALGLPKQTSKKTYQSSQEIASDILESLGHPNYLERVEIAGPGFINFFLKDESLVKVLDEKIKEGKKNKRAIVEYADPNTHKAFHIGHVRPLVYGESVARLLEFQGYQVYRSNYGSDIGPTVAKTLWGINNLKDEFDKVRESGSLRERADFLGQAYAVGHKNYEENPAVKAEIDAITIKLYQRDPEYLPLWEETKQWSLAYFDTIYHRFNIEFDIRINESEVDQSGKKIVEENIGRVFVQDQGAVIFPGDKHGLHNRVFITSQGNPTYEAKELGLTRRYEELFPFDELIILSDNPQAGFFKVVIKAMEMIDSRLVGKKRHLGFGSIALTSGKMSSRLGNIVSAEEVLEKTTEELEKIHGKADQAVVTGAIKFEILKYSLSGDITYDPKKSVSLQGDSGPYVQYTFARTQSVLENAKKLEKKTSEAEKTLADEEREVLKNLEYAQMVIDQAAKNLDPNQICYYLLNLAKAYNLFYQKCPILKSDKEALRLAITEKTGEYIKLGLNLLGIEAPDHM